MPRTARILLIVAPAIALLAIVAARSLFVVDETQYALVTEFGREIAVLGDQPGESGLHAKAPWRSVLLVDRRLHVTEPAAREVITGDKHNLEVAPYVVWRVADPARFVRSAGTLEAAEARLDERIAAALSNAVGRRPLDALASTNADIWALDDLTADVLAEVAAPARDELGVEVSDVRLRQFNYPLEVRPAIFDLIRSERQQVASTLRAEGDAQYQAIVSEADRKRDAILAAADAEAERIRGRGEAEATHLLNEAHARDPRFYEFLRTLETYRAVLDGRATVILSSASPLLRLLTEGPPAELTDGPGRPPNPPAESSPGAGAPVAGAAGPKP